MLEYTCMCLEATIFHRCSRKIRLSHARRSSLEDTFGLPSHITQEHSHNKGRAECRSCVKRKRTSCSLFPSRIVFLRGKFLCRCDRLSECDRRRTQCGCCATRFRRRQNSAANVTPKTILSLSMLRHARNHR